MCVQSMDFWTLHFKLSLIVIKKDTPWMSIRGTWPMSVFAHQSHQSSYKQYSQIYIQIHSTEQQETAGEIR